MESLIVTLEPQKNNIIAQSNQLTEARYTLSVAEQRLVINLLSLISPRDKNFKNYEIKIADFKNLLGIDSNDIYAQVKLVLNRLAKHVINIPTKNGYIITHWFSSAEYNAVKGTVEVSFDEKLKPYLLQLKEQFTKYRLFIVTQFKSAYTVRIYMLLKQYETVGYREFDLIELREILGIDKKLYPDFKRFRARVLNQAKREFEKKNKDNGCYNSDVSFDLETIRTGRRITRLRFNIKKQVYQEPLPLEIEEISEQPPIQEKSSAVLALEKYGINEVQTQEFVEEYGEEYILRCVSLFEEASKAGKVKNKGAGYLIKLIQAGAGNQTEAEKQAITRVEEKTKKEQEKKKQKFIEDLENNFRKKAKREFIVSLSEEEKGVLLQEAKKEFPEMASRMDSLESPYSGAFIVQKIKDYEVKKQAYITKHLQPKGGKKK